MREHFCNACIRCRHESTKDGLSRSPSSPTQFILTFNYMREATKYFVRTYGAHRVSPGLADAAIVA